MRWIKCQIPEGPANAGRAFSLACKSPQPEIYGAVLHHVLFEMDEEVTKEQMDEWLRHYRTDLGIEEDEGLGRIAGSQKTEHPI